LEGILAERAEVIGSQFEPYKNHVYRVLNFCFAFHECHGDDEEKLIIAACFVSVAPSTPLFFERVV
jgi:hypothetical protein